ncbi:hypothetical protein VPH35_007789 [Triticum aestivum]|uniref:uncharacterized protein n=1 Tax=Triticum aestivum TaxID=4565 RepID=UPI001D020B68|nr:uncharacterized protein LOC123117295 [Triticum aestivum]
MEPTLLQYKVLIHLDEVCDYTNVGEPWFLGSSSSSGQSGIPDDGDGPRGGGTVVSARRAWQFGVPDVRGQSAGDTGGGDRWSRQRGGSMALPSWKLPPMVPHAAILGSGPALPVRDCISVRVSAFDRLDGPAIAARECSNPRHSSLSPTDVVRPARDDQVVVVPTHKPSTCSQVATCLATESNPTIPTPVLVEEPSGNQLREDEDGLPNYYTSPPGLDLPRTVLVSHAVPETTHAVLMVADGGQLANQETGSPVRILKRASCEDEDKEGLGPSVVDPTEQVVMIPTRQPIEPFLEGVESVENMDDPIVPSSNNLLALHGRGAQSGGWDGQVHGVRCSHAVRRLGGAGGAGSGPVQDAGNRRR